MSSRRRAPKRPHGAERRKELNYHPSAAQQLGRDLPSFLAEFIHNAYDCVKRNDLDPADVQINFNSTTMTLTIENPSGKEDFVLQNFKISANLNRNDNSDEHGHYGIGLKDACAFCVQDFDITIYHRNKKFHVFYDQDAGEEEDGEQRGDTVVEQTQEDTPCDNVTVVLTATNNGKVEELERNVRFAKYNVWAWLVQNKMISLECDIKIPRKFHKGKVCINGELGLWTDSAPVEATEHGRVFANGKSYPTELRTGMLYNIALEKTNKKKYLSGRDRARLKEWRYLAKLLVRRKTNKESVKSNLTELTTLAQYLSRKVDAHKEIFEATSEEIKVHWNNVTKAARYRKTEHAKIRAAAKERRRQEAQDRQAARDLINAESDRTPSEEDESYEEDDVEVDHEEPESDDEPRVWHTSPPPNKLIFMPTKNISGCHQWELTALGDVHATAQNRLLLQKLTELLELSKVPGCVVFCAGPAGKARWDCNSKALYTTECLPEEAGLIDSIHAALLALEKDCVNFNGLETWATTIANMKIAQQPAPAHKPRDPGNFVPLLVIDEWGSSTGGIAAFNMQLATGLASKGQVYLWVGDDRHIDNLPANICHLHGESPDVLGCATSITAIVGHAQKNLATIYRKVLNCDQLQHCKKLGFVHTIPSTNSANAAKAKHKQEVIMALAQQCDAIWTVGDAIDSHWRPQLRDIPCFVYYPPLNAHFLDTQKNSGTTILAVGRFDTSTYEQKGFDIFAAVVKACSARKYNFVLRGAKDDADVKQMKTTAGIGGPNLVIRTHGNHINIKDDLRSALVLLMPSYHEPFGLVAWEAIAAGVLPIMFGKSGGGERLTQLAAGAGIDLTHVVVDRDYSTPDIENKSKSFIDAVRHWCDNAPACRKRARELQQLVKNATLGVESFIAEVANVDKREAGN